MRNSLHRTAGLLAMLALLFTLAPALPAAEGGTVNLNTATEEELVALPGIGPSKAKAIIEYRNVHRFESAEELKNVRGIGDHIFESLKGKVRVETAGAGAATRKRQTAVRREASGRPRKARRPNIAPAGRWRVAGRGG